MNNWKKLIYSLIICIAFLGVLKLFLIRKDINNEKREEKLINNFSLRLQECFDLENKSNRSLIESINLIEYCMNRFGDY